MFRSNVGIHGTRDVDCTSLCRKGSKTSPGLVQPVSAAFHLPATGAEVKTRGTSIRLHGLVFMHTSCFNENFCAKSLSVGLFHCQDEEQFYA